MNIPMIPSPDGATKVFVIFGDPVAQVLAPPLMNEAFYSVGANAVMVPMQVSPSEIGNLIEALKVVENIDGFLATIPHKFELLKHADSMSAIAEAAGCANALRRDPDGSWSAENFDGIGFVRGMLDQGYEVREKHISIYGSGGAGSSIAAAVLDAGAADVRVIDVSPQRSEDLCKRLNAQWVGKASTGSLGSHLNSDIVVNATPMGLSNTDALPFAIEGLRPHAVIAEIIMKPAETNLLREARSKGFQTQAGINMLKPQIDFYRQFFRIPKDNPANSAEVEGLKRGAQQ